jgi:hypothetical protein
VWLGQGVLLGVLLYGVAATRTMWTGREPWCWPVLEGLKVFLLLVLSCIGAMFFVLIPVLVTVVILFVVIEYLKGVPSNPRRLRFMPFCRARAREIVRFLCAIAVSEGNKVGVGAFVTLFLLSWLFGTPCTSSPRL